MYKFTFVNTRNIPGSSERSKFIVDKQKRTVVCISNVILNNIDDMFGYDMVIYITKKLKKSKLIPSNCYYLDDFSMQVIGIAKCDPSDEFDESIGKKIAETRMRQHVYSLMERINFYCEEYISMLKTKLDFAKEKTNFLKSREMDHCKDLIYSTGIKPC